MKRSAHLSTDPEWVNALRFRGRAWCKAFTLTELITGTQPTSVIGTAARVAITTFDVPALARLAVKRGLLGELKESGRFDELEAGTWRACSRAEGLAWAHALQARYGCEVSARALQGMEHQEGAWAILDTSAVAVVTQERITVFFDAG